MGKSRHLKMLHLAFFKHSFTCRCIRQFHFRDWGQVTGCFRKTMEKSTQASSQHGRQKLLQMLHLVCDVTACHVVFLSRVLRIKQERRE